MNAPISNLTGKVLSRNWYLLKNWSFRFTRRDGSTVDMKREVYDRGNGATILLINKARRSVILTRQFRLPTYLNGNVDGMLIEAAAGLLDEDAPIDAIRREAMEETGYQVGAPQPLYDLYMSPGAVTERVHFFVAKVTDTSRTGTGGGVESENEDIEVLELPFDTALDMLRDGRIRDAKTALLLLHAQVMNLFD